MRDRQGGIIGATVTPTTSSASGVWTLREAERFQRGGIWPARPGAPTSLAGTGGNAQVALTWTAPTSNGGSAITGYVVEYTPSGGSASTVSTGSASASYTVTGLTNGTSYTFRVAAVNALGTGSYSTASGSVTPSGSKLSITNGVSTSGSGTLSSKYVFTPTILTSYGYRYGAQFQVTQDGTAYATITMVNGDGSGAIKTTTVTNGTDYINRGIFYTDGATHTASWSVTAGTTFYMMSDYNFIPIYLWVV